MKKSRILILSASYGQGHEAVGRAIAAALQSRPNKGTKVVLVDIAHELRRHTNRLFTKTYERTTRYTPSVYGFVYKATNNPYSQEFIRWLAVNTNRRRLKKYLYQQKPDVIVCVFPVWAHLVEGVIKPEEKWYKFVNVLTDCGEVHSAWTIPSIDHYIVADKQTAKLVSNLNIEKSKIHALGYPVSLTLEHFSSQAQARASLTLPVSEDTILYVASGDHLLYAAKVIRHLKRLNKQVVIICGRNKRVLRPLSWLFAQSQNITIVGWTDRMPEYITAADVVVTKAGGSTVMECLALRRPLIVNRVIPGQEEGNAKLIERNKLGFIEYRPKAIARKAATVLNNRENFARQLDKYQADPGAARKVADFIVSLCP